MTDSDPAAPDQDHPTERSPETGPREQTPQDSAAPTQIGPYRVLERIGAGGMGEVFLAEQREPVRRRVALKVVPRGANTEQVLARFEQERQALAVMSHEHIAKVFDAGATPDGQPFFVMELVEGKPLDQYCDDHRLTLQERIELFQRVCDGVQHAHQKGVMHRDLKPGNVLVVERDGRHIPKIIDFGLARATDTQLIDRTLVTEQGQLMGTPEYMSPEQARGDALQIDTRTDVYSLGVLLYKLLCGQLPFSPDELRRQGFMRIRQIISEEEPKRPSTRVTTIDGEDRSRIERGVRLDARSLSRSLTGDLDWIVMRAMAKEPERRYPTPAGLALDLRRFLEHEPVEAGPPTFRYRCGKFVRKNRLQVSAAAIVFVALAAGIGASLTYADRALAAESLANRRADDLGEANSALAERTRQFDQLSGVVIYRRAKAAAASLFPAWPGTIGAFDAWLSGDVATLREMRPEIRRTLDSLGREALPWTDEDRARDRRAHPLFAEWERASQRLAVLDLADRVRNGEPFEAPALPPTLGSADVAALNTYAWPLVDQNAEKRPYGQEGLALAAVKRAIELVEEAGQPIPYQLLDTLTWAQFAHGLDEEARQSAQRAIAAAPESERQTMREYAQELDQRIARAAEDLRAARQRVEELEQSISKRLTWTFPSDEQGQAKSFLHGMLTRLDADLEQLFDNEVAAIERDRNWALRIEELSRAHPNARTTWAAARDALATADGVVAHEAYAKHFSGAGAIGFRPQLGLVPIGMNPATKLWEFYHLRSAWDGERDPAELEIPRHDAEGGIEVGDETGMIFVLLPGGRFEMGAQSADPDAPRYDPSAHSDESPIHEVELAPYFLARHEITKAQWARIAEGDQPSWFQIGRTYAGNPDPTSAHHPVDQVDWIDADRRLRACGLTLPTEARWEFACRAGTSTPWLSGSDASSLAGFANVLDKTGAEVTGTWGQQEGEFDDGRGSQGPVGWYRPNAFGVYDMHGSLWEWCLDAFGRYGGPLRDGDGLRLIDDASGDRAYRGGSYYDPASRARSAMRSGAEPRTRNATLGVRAARSLDT